MNYARFGIAGLVLVVTVFSVPVVIKRLAVESLPSAVEICLDFDAVNTVALRTGVSVKSILSAAREDGVSSVVLSEDALGEGAAEPALLKRRYGFVPGKLPEGSFLPDFWNDALPAGFSEKKIKAIESAGLSVVLRPQNTGNPAWMAADRQVAGRKLLLDSREIPGYSDPASLIKRLPDNLLVVLEFTSVAGIDTLKRLIPGRIIQGHAIYPQEQVKNADDAVWVARWARAVCERGNRFLLVYLRELDSLDRNRAYIRSISAAVRREGYQTGLVSAPPYPFGAHTGFRLAMTLVCALVFPLCALSWGKRLSTAWARYAAVNAVTVMGGLVVAALLFDGSFMQRIIAIPFVKAVMLAPVLLSTIILFRVEDIKRWWMQPVQVRHVVVFVVIMLVFFLFMLRAGNAAGDWARPEMGMRQWLENALSIRPRTKEFLFGQPLLFAGFASGNAWLVWLGMIGQVSIINTFLHAHTPVLLSLVRVLYGIVIGLAIGWTLAFVIRWINNRADVKNP